MKQRNCKNCGAPLEHSYNHKCPYCDTLYDFNDDDVKQITPDDLADLELYDVQRKPEFDVIQLIFKGYIRQKPKIYEYDGKNNYVSNVIEYSYEKVKDGFILIEVPMYEFRQSNNDICFIYSLLASKGIDIWEHRNLEYSIKDKMKGYMLVW